MPKLNSDKAHLWKSDIADSVDFYNNWFLRFAPNTFRSKRIEVTHEVTTVFANTGDLNCVTSATLEAHPEILPTLRMCCCPPIARERLSGLAGVGMSLLSRLEEGLLPKRMSKPDLTANLDRLIDKLRQLFDVDLIPWLTGQQPPKPADRDRAASVIADRLCGSISDPIIRNEQEVRQITTLRQYLCGKGYVEQAPVSQVAVTSMPPGTFAIRFSLKVGTPSVKLPLDAIVQPHVLRKSQLPVMFELKSAGDFTNVNKRRKEEAKKMSQLKGEFGSQVEYILMLCGYFNAGYLGYEAAEGIDWVWEHRLTDLDQFGL